LSTKKQLITTGYFLNQKHCAFGFLFRLKIRWVLEGYKKKSAERELIEAKGSIKTPKGSARRRPFGVSCLMKFISFNYHPLNLGSGALLP